MDHINYHCCHVPVSLTGVLVKHRGGQTAVATLRCRVRPLRRMDRNVPTGLVTGVRLFSSIGSIVLSFPLLNVAMRGAACNGQQSTFGTDCYGLGHIGLANACILLWVLTLPTFMLCDVVFLDRNPLSASLAAKAHGE